jgi:hypothetical protein
MMPFKRSPMAPRTRHQGLLREPAAGAQQDACARPAAANVRDDARHLLDRIRRGTHAPGLQSGRQQVALISMRLTIRCTETRKAGSSTALARRLFVRL